MNDAAELLVDPITGIITHLDREPSTPGDPHRYVAVHGTVSRTDRIDPWLADPVSMGTSFGSEQHARVAAIGEAVERYCGNFVPSTALQRASYAELHAAGRTALHPRELVLYSDQQYADSRLGLDRMDTSLRQLWTSARELGSGRDVLVPGSTVWVNWYDGPRRDEPRTNYPWLAGLAAGSSRDAAIESAAAELIERDAIEIWWRGGFRACRIHDLGTEWDAALDGLSGASLDVLLVPSRFAVPVVVVVLHDERGGFSCLGSACRTDVTTAALKALAEAIHLRHLFWDFCDPNGVHWTAARSGFLAPEIARRFRADRHYLDDFYDDFVDVLDLAHQALVHLDPRHHSRWQRELSQHVDADRMAVPSAIVAVESCRTALQRDGCRLLCVDLTTSDVARAGLAVVRLIAPGLVTNAPAGIAHLGTDRYRTDAAVLGQAGAHQLILSPVPHV